LRKNCVFGIEIEDNSYWEILYHILNQSPYYNLHTIIIVSPEFDGSYSISQYELSSILSDSQRERQSRAAPGGMPQVGMQDPINALQTLAMQGTPVGCTPDKNKL
jgi:hypothetical protein